MRPSLLLALFISLTFAAHPASASTSDEHPVIAYSAETLPSGTFTLGLWDIGYAPTDWLILETYTWPWLLRVANASLKLRFYKGEDWTFSGKIGALRLDMQAIADDAPPTVLWAVPFELSVTWRLNDRWSLSSSFIYTSVIQDGSYESDDLKGAAGYSNSQMTFQALFRLNKGWSLFLRSRHLLKVKISGEIQTTVPIDAYTHLETHASASADDLLGMGFPQTLHVVPGLAWNGETFFFEAGLGYGNFNIPGLNFFIPDRSVVPQFDLGWRW